MRISHDNKFVFIAIPKTGSTTVRKLLDNFSDIKSMHLNGNFAMHATAQQVKSEFVVKGWCWIDYYKFTVVRNPIARLLSFHSYMIDVSSRTNNAWIKANASGFLDQCVRYASYGLTFEECVLSNKISMPSQAKRVLSVGGEMLFDSFVKLENISVELPLVWKRIGLPEAAINDIPKLNTSTRSFNEDMVSSLDERVVRKIRMDYAGLRNFDY